MPITESPCQPVAGLNKDNANNRPNEIQRLYLGSYSHIIGAAQNDPRLTAHDAHVILQGAERYLDSYSGPLDQKSFNLWVTGVIQPSIKLQGLINENKQVVIKAIWSVIRGCERLGEESCLSKEAEHLSHLLWVWAFEHIDDLQTPGTAKTSTRLYARAVSVARAWRSKRLKECERFIPLTSVDVWEDENHQKLIAYKSDPNRRQAA